MAAKVSLERPSVCPSCDEPEANRCLAVLVAFAAAFVCHGAQARWIVYQSNPDDREVMELFLVDVARVGNEIVAGESVKLNQPIPQREPADDLAYVAPIAAAYSDGLIYLAEATRPGVSEAFAVFFDTPGQAVPLTPPAEAGSGTITYATVTSDGRWLLYVEADTETADDYRVKQVDLAAPGQAVELYKAEDRVLVHSSPDGNYLLVSTLDEKSPNAVLIDLMQDAAAVEIPMPEPGTISTYMFPATVTPPFSFDGRWLAFVWGRDAPATSDLFVVDLQNPTQAVRVNPPLGSGGRVLQYQFSPDSTQIVYRAQQEPDQPLDVWLTTISELGTALRLNPDLSGSPCDLMMGCLTTEVALFTDDGESVIYDAQQDLQVARELYEVAIEEPASAVKLSAPLDERSLAQDGVMMTFPQIGENGLEYLGRFVGYIDGFFPPFVDDPTGMTTDTDQHAPSVIIDRERPGVAIRPFRYEEPSFSAGGLISPDSTMVAIAIYPGNVLTTGSARADLYVAATDVDDSAVRINPEMGDGIFAEGARWVQHGAPSLRAAMMSEDGG